MPPTAAVPPPRLPLDDPTLRLMVLTGAGVSAESGLATFRDADGLWLGEDPLDVAHPAGFAADPARVWSFHQRLRREAAVAEPNAAHHALAELEARLGDRMLLVTQNIDGLHQRAGSRRVVEFHGTIDVTRCSSCRLEIPTSADADELPRCPACGSPARHAVTWFDETLDPERVGTVFDWLNRGLEAPEPFALLAVGTSGTVPPSSVFAAYVRREGGATWLVNLAPPVNVAEFDVAWYGPAAELLPVLVGA